MKENPGPWDATLALGVVIAALLFSPLPAVLLVSAFVGMSNRLTRFGVSDQVAYVVAVFLAALGVLLLVGTIRRMRRRRADGRQLRIASNR